MQNDLGIKAKLFLGIAILITGYLVSASVGFIVGAGRERELAAVGSVSVPASLKCQSALFDFEGGAKTYTDAIMTGEPDTLKAAAASNGRCASELEQIARSASEAGLDPVTVNSLREQVIALDHLRAEVFAGMSGNAAGRDAASTKAEALTASTERVRQQITGLSATAATTLNDRLGGVTAATRRQRIANLLIALIVVAAGGGIVLLVIERGIIRPIRSVTHGLHESADRVETASSTIRESGRQLADGASAQAASLEETSAALEQISSVAKRNADHSSDAKGKVSSARAAAERSAADIQTMRAAMTDIKSASNNIAKIVKAIDEIAFQTNILALNAAVEAARAGDAGAGFAVVAEEVRNLAHRSAQAARETANLIEDSITKSDRGAQMSAKVASGLEEIGSQIREIDALVAEIASASQEQSNGVTEVNRTVVRLNETTQANAAAAEESASTVEELAVQVKALNGYTNDLASTVYGRFHGRINGRSAPSAAGSPEAFLPERGDVNRSSRSKPSPVSLRR